MTSQANNGHSDRHFSLGAITGLSCTCLPSQQSFSSNNQSPSESAKTQQSVRRSTHRPKMSTMENWEVGKEPSFDLSAFIAVNLKKNGQPT